MYQKQDGNHQYDAPELDEAERFTHHYVWNEENQSWDKEAK